VSTSRPYISSMRNQLIWCCLVLLEHMQPLEVLLVLIVHQVRVGSMLVQCCVHIYINDLTFFFFAPYSYKKGGISELRARGAEGRALTVERVVSDDEQPRGRKGALVLLGHLTRRDEMSTRTCMHAMPGSVLLFLFPFTRHTLRNVDTDQVHVVVVAP
jgi:hypothetical protein